MISRGRCAHVLEAKDSSEDSDSEEEEEDSEALCF